MHRGGPAAEQPVIVKQLGRRATVVGLGRGVLGRLLAEVDVQGPLPAASPILLSASAGTARTEWTAAPMRTWSASASWLTRSCQ